MVITCPPCLARAIRRLVRVAHVVEDPSSRDVRIRWSTADDSAAVMDAWAIVDLVGHCPCAACPRRLVSESEEE